MIAIICVNFDECGNKLLISRGNNLYNILDVNKKKN